MAVMKHLLQWQQAGRPGSPPAWKCHDRFPLVIATVFLQRLKGMESHRTIIRHPSPCTPSLADSCTPSPSPCPLPSTGSSQCRQGRQQPEGPGPTTSPLRNAGPAMPHAHNSHPPTTGVGEVSHFQKAVQILNFPP